MPVALVVLALALSAAAAVFVLARRPGSPAPIDPEPEERWLLRRIGDHPRWGATARHVDRQVIGGVALVAALVVVFATAFVVGLVFDMVDRDRGLARWDRAVADWGSSHATAGSTRLLDAVTDLGGTTVLVVVCAVVAAVDVVRRRNVDVALFLTAVLGGVVLLNNGLKLVVDRERPDVVHLVGTSGSSFPSGHSASAAAVWFAVALVVSRSWPRRGRAVAAAAAGLVAIAVATSRALLGVHWLTDVVAGVFVGWGWFLLVALAFGGRLQRLGEPAERAAAGGVVTAGSRPPP